VPLWCIPRLGHPGLRSLCFLLLNLMSNWIAIAKSDLYNSKCAALIDAADSVALGQGQTDRTTGVMADVTLEIRRRVAKSNQLDANTAAIPGGLKPRST